MVAKEAVTGELLRHYRQNLIQETGAASRNCPLITQLLPAAPLHDTHAKPFAPQSQSTAGMEAVALQQPRTHQLSRLSILVQGLLFRLSGIYFISLAFVGKSSCTPCSATWD